MAAKCMCIQLKGLQGLSWSCLHVSAACVACHGHLCSKWQGTSADLSRNVILGSQHLLQFYIPDMQKLFLRHVLSSCPCSHPRYGRGSRELRRRNRHHRLHAVHQPGGARWGQHHLERDAWAALTRLRRACWVRRGRPVRGDQALEQFPEAHRRPSVHMCVLSPA